MKYKEINNLYYICILMLTVTTVISLHVVHIILFFKNNKLSSFLLQFSTIVLLCLNHRFKERSKKKMRNKTKSFKHIISHIFTNKQQKYDYISRYLKTINLCSLILNDFTTLLQLRKSLGSMQVLRHCYEKYQPFNERDNIVRLG